MITRTRSIARDLECATAVCVRCFEFLSGRTEESLKWSSPARARVSVALTPTHLELCGPRGVAMSVEAVALEPKGLEKGHGRCSAERQQDRDAPITVHLAGVEAVEDDSAVAVLDHRAKPEDRALRVDRAHEAR